MKLIADLIHYRLTNDFDVTYAASSDKSQLAGRPVYFLDKLTARDHLCIISPDALPDVAPERGVYIFIGDPPQYLLSGHAEFLSVPTNVSREVLFNKLQLIFDYYDSWAQELTAITDAELGYRALIQCATKYLDIPFSLIDKDFNFIAYSEKYAEYYSDDIDNNKISPAALNDLVSSPMFEKVIEENDVFEYTLMGRHFLCYNFKLGEKYLGRIISPYGVSFSKEITVFFLKFLAFRIEVMLKKFGSFLAPQENRSPLRELLSDILRNNSVDKIAAANIINAYGWHTDDEYMVIRLQPEFRHDWQLHAPYLIPQIEQQWPSICAIEYNNYLVAVFNQTVYTSKSGRDFIQELVYFLREGLMLAGFSRSFIGLDQLNAYFRQTELAISIGMTISTTRWYYLFDDCALYCWLKFGVSGFTPEQICSKSLLKLKAHDQQNNTDYYGTIYALYKNRFSYTQAAQALYIHRTTFINRMDRIAELTDLNLKNNDERLYIDMSIRYFDDFIK